MILLLGSEVFMNDGTERWNHFKTYHENPFLDFCKLLLPLYNGNKSPCLKLFINREIGSFITGFIEDRIVWYRFRVRARQFKRHRKIEDGYRYCWKPLPRRRLSQASRQIWSYGSRQFQIRWSTSSRDFKLSIGIEDASCFYLSWKILGLLQSPNAGRVVEAKCLTKCKGSWIRNRDKQQLPQQLVVEVHGWDAMPSAFIAVKCMHSVSSHCSFPPLQWTSVGVKH